MLELRDRTAHTGIADVDVEALTRRSRWEAGSSDARLAETLDAIRLLIGAEGLAVHLLDGEQMGLPVSIVGGGLEPDNAAFDWTHLNTDPGEANWLARAEDEEAVHVSTVQAQPEGMRFLLLCRPATRGAPGRRILERRMSAARRLIEDALSHWIRLTAELLDNRAQLAILNLLGHAMLVIDADCHICASNAAARALLSRSQGISSRGNRLTIARIDEAMRFQVLVHHALLASTDGPHVATISQAGSAPMMLAIQALPSPGDSTSFALVQIIDPAAEVSLPLESLAWHYGWTPVECRLIEKLVAGKTLSEAAAAMRLKEQTARTYLKHIFQKTGMRRQVEVIRLVLAGAKPKSPSPSERQTPPLPGSRTHMGRRTDPKWGFRLDPHGDG